MLATVIKKKTKAGKMPKLRQAMWSANVENNTTKLQWLNNPIILAMVPKVLSRKQPFLWEPKYMMEQFIVRVSLDVPFCGCMYISNVT